MPVDNLVHMANRIGQFFQAMPDYAEATEGIAQHLLKFWEPRMRRELLEHLQVQQGFGLQPIVLDALRQHRQILL